MLYSERETIKNKLLGEESLTTREKAYLVEVLEYLDKLNEEKRNVI